ncbi:MAG: DUF6152 family protein [Acidobacteriota bacterium]|nr:DUF6152 family protein [Acidobacteriota bacterium]
MSKIDAKGAMRNFLLICAVVAVGLLASTKPAWAHHGYAAYDETKLLSLKGTVTDYELENPHSTMSFDVKGENGKVESWEGEAGHIRLMLDLGWTRKTLKAGDVVTFYFHPAKNGSHAIDLVKITIPDGRTLNCHSSGEAAAVQ